MAAETPREHFARIARLTAERAAEAAAAGTPPKPERVLPRVSARIAAEMETARHGIGGNGAPPLEPKPRPQMSRRGRLSMLSMAMYGERFGQEMAQAMDVSARTMRRWLNEGDAVPDYAMQNAREAGEAQIRAIRAALDRLDDLPAGGEPTAQPVADPAPAAPVDEPPAKPAVPARVVDPRQVDLVEYIASLG